MVDRYAVSEAEWAAGGMEPAKLARLARSFARDGAVVLENCLPHGVLDALALRMDSDAAHQMPLRWQLWKRYNQFETLHKQLLRLVPDLAARLPPKQHFGRLKPGFIEQRSLPL